MINQYNVLDVKRLISAAWHQKFNNVEAVLNTLENVPKFEETEEDVANTIAMLKHLYSIA